MDAAAEIRRNPSVSTRLSLRMEMSRLTGRLNPSRETKFSGTHMDRGIFIFPIQLTTSRIGNLTRLIHTLLYVMTIIHKYKIHVMMRRKTVFVVCTVASIL